MPKGKGQKTNSKANHNGCVDLQKSVHMQQHTRSRTPCSVTDFKHNVQKFGRQGDFWMSQNGLHVLKLNLSGASIALNFNGPKRTESYKNEKSNVLTPDCKQINPTLFHTSVSNSFKKFQIYTAHFSFEKHINKY